MPDHIHLITDGKHKSTRVLQFANGITARRVLNYLKENEYESSLRKLRQADKKRNHKYTLFEHHPNIFSINNERTLMQKVNYVHQNPVRAGLARKSGRLFVFECADLVEKTFR